ncbi:MAG TPA: molecular chaperone TorD family protein [Bacilli bacterium]
MWPILELYARLTEYPNELIVPEIHSLARKLRDCGNAESALNQLAKFGDGVEHASVAELQELFTRTFDLLPVCSPHLGFQLFGESYKRGSLMAMLREEYRRVGLSEGAEIPDHLSCVLKLCALLSKREQEREVYAELLTLIVLPGVDKMVAAFAAAPNPYKHLLQSLASWLSAHSDFSQAGKIKMG